MRREYFAALRPVCPVCRAATLAVNVAIREEGDDLLEGILGCTNDACLREYPVIDGIPILVAAIRGWLAANPLQVLQRDDLSPELESLLGDVLGAGSPYDTLRQQVGIYAGAHYPECGNAVAALPAAALPPQSLPAIDIGCAVGGTTFALAEKLGRLTVGVDLNFAMLRVAARALREQRVRHASRRVGLVYDRRDIAVELPAREHVDFWCCDAAALPFADGTFAAACALNVVDCVAAPRELVAECARVLCDGGVALFSTPYDWTPTATPVEQWLGGHSQRGPNRGAAEPVLRALVANDFEIVAEEENVPWRLRLHERASIDYAVHLVTARRVR